MRVENVEIYSDVTNAAVLRHPGRKFPGVLVQGDTLYSLCSTLDIALSTVSPTSDEFAEIHDVRNSLWSLLTHYKNVLAQHGLPTPFSE
ncbi:MAG: hypothetical protein R3C00_13115 [Hyphomonas sp.]